MLKTTCANCLWVDKCYDTTLINIKKTRICEYYESIYDDGLSMQEYEQSLREREEDYQKVIDEQNGYQFRGM